MQWVYENETLEELLKQFITGHYHMAVVRTVIYPSHGDNYYKTVGELKPYSHTYIHTIHTSKAGESTWIKALTALASIFSSVRGKLRKLVTAISTKGTV